MMMMMMMCGRREAWQAGHGDTGASSSETRAGCKQFLDSFSPLHRTDSITFYVPRKGKKTLKKYHVLSGFLHLKCHSLLHFIRFKHDKKMEDWIMIATIMPGFVFVFIHYFQGREKKDKQEKINRISTRTILCFPSHSFTSRKTWQQQKSWKISYFQY